MKVVDLSLTLNETLRGVQFEPKYNVERDGWNAQTLHLYSHCATHMDAPVHFNAGPQTIDQIPLESCIGKAWIVELRHLPPKALISVDDLGELSAKVSAGDGLLLRTGWSRHVEDPQYYRDNFQGISPSLAQWMVRKEIRVVGVEAPSVADVNNLPLVTEVHQILFRGNVIIVEGLTNLDALPGESCTFGAFPLKVAGGDGAPCRAFAIV